MTDTVDQQKPRRSQTRQGVRNGPEESPPRKNVECLVGETETETRRNMSALICGSELAAYRVINAVDGQNECAKEWDVPILMQYLRDQASAVQGGNMSHAEAMLTNQATALQSLFARLVERGMSQNILSNMEGFMKLALRAQNQCRATLETLATIKNPPVVYTRQANFANGPQQINNGHEAPHALEDKIEQNQLLEEISNERLDFGATKTAGGTNQELATVGKIDRATDRERKTGQRKAR